MLNEDRGKAIQLNKPSTAWLELSVKSCSATKKWTLELLKVSTEIFSNTKFSRMKKEPTYYFRERWDYSLKALCHCLSEFTF